MAIPGVQSRAKSNPRLEFAMAELYEKSRGREVGLSREQFASILAEVAAKYLREGSGPAEVEELYRGLRVEELALARACAAGDQHAWEIFLGRYRAKLYDIAAGIAHEYSASRELADALYADLYGTEKRGGQRISKLASYTGRGSLEGWLRTVMAQQYINRYRQQRRLVSLDEESEDGRQFAAPDSQPDPPPDSRLCAATDEALAGLSSEDRFLLAAYYLDGRTLAHVARMLGVHESTISRKLDKLVKSLRKRIMALLVQRGMSRRQAEEAIDVDVRDLEMNIRGRLTQKSSGGAFPEKSAEAEE
jgi:RNA polymerase sigma-70 factor, ECF subfamily